MFTKVQNFYKSFQR